jgi:hypothetical protein
MPRTFGKESKPSERPTRRRPTYTSFIETKLESPIQLGRPQPLPALWLPASRFPSVPRSAVVFVFRRIVRKRLSFSLKFRSKPRIPEPPSARLWNGSTAGELRFSGRSNAESSESLSRARCIPRGSTQIFIFFNLTASTSRGRSPLPSPHRASADCLTPASVEFMRASHAIPCWVLPRRGMIWEVIIWMVLIKMPWVAPVIWLRGMTPPVSMPNPAFRQANTCRQK